MNSPAYNLIKAIYPNCHIFLFISCKTIDFHQNDIQITPDGKRTHRLKYVGYTKYVYLLSLPSSELNSQPAILRELEILKRKFSEITISDVEPNRIRITGVPAPLPEKAYKKMNFAAWKLSFQTYHTDSFDLKYGFKLEHSRAFANEVKSRPDELVDLVDQLIDERTVPDDYIVKGIEGLIDANFYIDRLLKIYKKALKIEFDREQTLYLVWKADFFINRKIVDREILDHLIALALNYPDPSFNKDGSLQSGINTVRGAAASRIVDCYYNPEFKDLIFSSLDKISEDPQDEVRISILPKLAYLNYLDEELVLGLFLKITDSKNIEILKISIVPLQFMINYDFERLIPYLKKLTEVSEMQKDIATVLTVAWISGKSQSLKLLNKVLKKGSDSVESAVHVATHNMFDAELTIQNKCKIMFKRFLAIIQKT